MINKKQLIEELLECVQDATDTETQITGLSMCATLMNEALDEALTIPVVLGQSEQLNVAWKALEWVGFTKGEEFTDDDIQEMLNA